MNVEETLEAAVAHHRRGERRAARALYEQILAAIPDQPQALHLLGVLAAQEGNVETAVATIRRAIEAWPHDVNFHINLAYILEGAGKFAPAAESYRRAAELAPQQVDLHFRCGNMLRLGGSMAQASARFEEVLRLDPTHAGALNNLAMALAELGQLDAALARSREAVARHPLSAPAHSNLGHMLKLTGLIHEAIASYRRATELDSANSQYHSNLVYGMTFDLEVSQAALDQELSHWNARHAAPLAPVASRPLHDATPDRRLRIGYVSPDFRAHVIGRNILPLLRHHDREAFEITCYSSVVAPDALTQEFQRLAAHYLPVAAETDEQLARRIAHDRIDILVDLTLHLTGCRLGVFARKPAPIQVAFAGYPGSSGIQTMDCRLTDPYLEPLGEAAGGPEQPRRLGASFWCYDPMIALPPVGPLPALAQGNVTLGSLNNFCKINDPLLELWARILRAVPHARLALLAGEGRHRQRVRDLLESFGIAPERVVFFPPCPRPEYFALYHRIDLGLDTLPYNGHTTSLDSLYMGVPVVTLVGGTVVGRAGLSQLSNLGMPELITRTPEEYVRVATNLATDLPRLQALRSTLRERMRNSPLMDAARFARDIETCYRELWRERCAQARGMTP